MDQENVVSIHNGILCSHEENEMLSFAGKQMELENIPNRMFSLICGHYIKGKHNKGIEL
jgi:hypothetical protein